MNHGRRAVHRIHNIKILFWAAVALFFMNALSFLFMPIALIASNESDRQLLILVGAFFWLSLILGYTLVFIANLERKSFIRNRLDGNLSMDCRMGIITFFANIPAIVADAAMVAAIAAFVIICFMDASNNYIAYVMLAIISFSLNMHCLFNGRIYKTTKFKRTRREHNYE